MSGVVIPFASPQEPSLEADPLRTYKSVYALCTVNQQTKELRATHYAAVLIGGSSPTWGVWTVAGRFVRFAASRAQIEKAYPRLVWRRKMATWSCADLEDKSVAKRRTELEELYGRRLPRIA